MNSDITITAYPEAALGGFSRYDGTIAFYSRVNALIRPEFVTLDIGCGRGAYGDDSVQFRRNLRILKGKCVKAIGIDVNPAGSANPYLDEFRQLDLKKPWPIEDASIDLAICDFVAEHLENVDSFFHECRRVIKPGGYLCIRTPNLFGYVALISNMIPNSLHAKIVTRAQQKRLEKDVFPTYYRCNTKSKIRSVLKKHGFSSVVYRHESEPDYLKFSTLTYRIGAVMHRIMPDVFKSVLFAFAQRENNS